MLEQSLHPYGSTRWMMPAQHARMLHLLHLTPGYIPRNSRCVPHIQPKATKLQRTPPSSFTYPNVGVLLRPLRSSEAMLAA